MAVGHDHRLKDGDPHFSIDTITRAIVNASSKKFVLMQYDTNSERFTFNMDRYVEGHDMLNCDKVQIHYSIMASSNRPSASGVYPVKLDTDFYAKPTNKDKIEFSWLVSENVTSVAGKLSFYITFECTQNEEILYRWSAGPNESIMILKKTDNGTPVMESYPDILAFWENRMDNHIEECETQLAENFDVHKTQINDEIGAFKREIRESMQNFMEERLTENGYTSVVYATSEEVKAIFDGAEPDVDVVFVDSADVIEEVEGIEETLVFTNNT